MRILALIFFVLLSASSSAADKEITLSNKDYTVVIAPEQLSCKVEGTRRSFMFRKNGDIIPGCADVDDDEGIYVTWDDKRFPALYVAPTTHFTPDVTEIPVHDKDTPIADPNSVMPSRTNGRILRS